MIAPHQAKKYTRLESPLQRFFYVNSKLFKSNSDCSEKYSQKIEVSKKEMENCHSAKRLGSDLKKPEVLYKMVVLENLRKYPGELPWWYILFDFTEKNTPPRMFSLEFFQMF